MEDLVPEPKNSGNGYDFDMSSYSTLGFALIILPGETEESDVALLCAVVDGGKLTMSTKEGTVKYEITFDVDEGTQAPAWEQIAQVPAAEEDSGANTPNADEGANTVELDDTQVEPTVEDVIDNGVDATDSMEDSIPETDPVV